jgi:tetratricopeptide (TPR) repeat protein
VWDSQSAHNYEAELLLDKLSKRCLLVEEMAEALQSDRSLPADLRREAIQLAKQRGNAPTILLQIDAWHAGINPNRSGPDYAQALRRATVANQLMPWFGESEVTLGLLQYRTGDFDQALRSSQRAMELQKSQSPDAHAIRAMAYYRLHDPAQARTELALAQASRSEFADRAAYPEASSVLVEEAEALLSSGRIW